MATDPVYPAVPEQGCPSQLHRADGTDSQGTPGSRPPCQGLQRPTAGASVLSSGSVPGVGGWLQPLRPSSHSRAPHSGPRVHLAGCLDSGLPLADLADPGGTQPSCFCHAGDGAQSPHTPCKGHTTEPHASPAGVLSALLLPHSTVTPTSQAGRGQIHCGRGVLSPQPSSPSPYSGCCSGQAPPSPWACCKAPRRARG